jgi:hypothetical protein
MASRVIDTIVLIKDEANDSTWEVWRGQYVIGILKLVALKYDDERGAYEVWHVKKGSSWIGYDNVADAVRWISGR